MARIVSSIPDRKPAPGAEEKHPYDEWLDGRVWCLEPGRDFKAGRASSMATNIRNAIQRRGIPREDVRVVQREGCIYVHRTRFASSVVTHTRSAS